MGVETVGRKWARLFPSGRADAYDARDGILVWRQEMVSRMYWYYNLTKSFLLSKEFLKQCFVRGRFV